MGEASGVSLFYKGNTMPLIEKEIIGPGTYWYVDENTGLPRKLEVTPEYTRYLHEQGSKMLSEGLPIPVPYEHDFNAHPMTPKDKLLNNSGWVKEYRIKDTPDGRKDVLHSVLDIQDEEVAKRLPNTIRWTSPWLNSFTDGKGNKWNNVISHVALTLRPRITNQQPFPSIAAALSMASGVKIDNSNPFSGDKGFCVSRAGQLIKNEKTGLLHPKYPIAFSLFNGIGLATDAGGRQHKGKGPGGGQFTKSKSSSDDNDSESESSNSSDGDSKESINKIREELDKLSAPQKKSFFQKFKEIIGIVGIANALAMVLAIGVSKFLSGAGKTKTSYPRQVNKNPMPPKPRKESIREKIGNYVEKAIDSPPSLSINAAFAGDEPPKKIPAKGEEDSGSDDSDELDSIMNGSDDDDKFTPDNDPSNDNTIDAPPFNDPKGDVTMEELLCDLLGALGIHCEKTGNEQQFKRSLYTAAMMKINELTTKAQNGDKPAPGEISNEMQKKPMNNQSNPMVQQEQPPMYMSLEEINKISDGTMKAIALSMYNENLKLRTEMEQAKKTTDSLRDAKLKDATTKRKERVALLGKISPKVKPELDAMVENPSMALSLGDGGEVVDPMAQTLNMLEKGLSDLPTLLTTPSSALSVHGHPKDGDELSNEEQDKLADGMARMMGAVPENKKAS